MPDSTRHCPRCDTDKPLSEYGAQSYCRPCFNAYRRECRTKNAVTVACSECQTPFRKSNGRELCCSKECGRKRTARLRGTGTPQVVACAHCGSHFMQPRSNSTHCSSACQDAAKYLRLKDDPRFRERRAEYARTYHLANRERLLVAGKKWRTENAERHAELTRRWWAANKYSTPSWRRRYPEKHAANERARQVRIRALTPFPLRHEDVVAKIAYWGNACWICGVDYEAVDHVKPIAKGGLNIIANLRPICNSHNSKKRDRWLGPSRLGELLV